MARAVLNWPLAAGVPPVIALLFVWFEVLHLLYFLYERWK